MLVIGKKYVSNFFIIYVQFFIRSTRLIFVCCPCMRLHCVIAESNASHLHLCPQIEMIGVNLKQNAHSAAFCCVVLNPLTCLCSYGLALIVYDMIRYDTNS